MQGLPYPSAYRLRRPHIRGNVTVATSEQEKVRRSHERVDGPGWPRRNIRTAVERHGYRRDPLDFWRPGCSRYELRTAPRRTRARSSHRVGRIGEFCGVPGAPFPGGYDGGPRVITYDPATREYLIGRVTGDWYESTDDEVSYVRPVQWYGAASRDALPTDARARLGAGTTIFRISEDVATELARAAGVQGWGGAPQVQRSGGDVQVVETSRVDETPPVGLDDDARAASAEDGIERIKDRVLDLEWDQMEALTAGLLRAMGYYSRITARGADGGRDVIATPDVLGLESPHIVAEVKHRKSAMGTPEIRSFIGGLRPGDRGLYVSTGGFTRDARLEADRSNIPVRLIDLDDFVRLYTDVYDRVDEETRALLPLVRIWWPA